MKSLRGKLLAASPYMRDANFARTVVLVLEHREAGALGVVLNRPLVGETVEQIWKQLGHPEDHPHARIHFGGPVAGPVVAVHLQEPLADIELRAGMFVAAQQSHLEQLLSDQQSELRLFIGHAGWAQGQLEDELAQGAWLVAPASAEIVFAETDDVWSQVVRSIGRQVIADTLGIRHIPDDVSLN